MVRHHGIPTKGLESTVSKGWRFRTHHFSMNSYNGSMNCKAASTHPTVDRRTAIARIWWIYRVDRNFRIFKAKVAIQNTPLSFQFFSLCTCKNDYTAYTWIHTQYMYCICMIYNICLYICLPLYIYVYIVHVDMAASYFRCPMMTCSVFYAMCLFWEIGANSHPCNLIPHSTPGSWSLCESAQAI